MSSTAINSLPKPETAANAATGLTFFSPNYSPGLSFGYFPQTGSVTLSYGPGSPPPSSVYIFHQGGQKTPVSVGQGVYTVSQGDYLMIEGNGASCKIQWFYN